jgi:hypothetical protein
MSVIIELMKDRIKLFKSAVELSVWQSGKPVFLLAGFLSFFHDGFLDESASIMMRGAGMTCFPSFKKDVLQE